MSWYEIRRIAAVSLAIDALVVAVCVAVCALFFSVTPVAVGTSLFFSTVGLVFVGVGVGGGATPMRMYGPYAPGQAGPLVGPLETEMLAQQTHRNLQVTLDQLRSLSWTLVFGIAALPLFALSVVLVMWWP